VRRVFFDLNIYMENHTLTVADMASLKNVLEAACNRGAFKAAEMSTVGQLYDKLSIFVAKSAEQLQAAEAPNPQGDTNA
jgi:hypothetical protein